MKDTKAAPDIFDAGYIDRVRAFFASRPGGDIKAPLAHVRTFGCQQNVSDSERIKGMLAQMGFGFTEEPEQADLILFNTCAVREHAEDRVFGNVGALKGIKRRRPDVLIALCGCMVQQEHIAQRIKASYPFVGLVFGTHVLHRFPELLYNALAGQERVFEIPEGDGSIVEDCPSAGTKFKAWLSTCTAAIISALLHSPVCARAGAQPHYRI